METITSWRLSRDWESVPFDQVRQYAIYAATVLQLLNGLRGLFLITLESETDDQLFAVEKFPSSSLLMNYDKKFPLHFPESVRAHTCAICSHQISNSY